MSNSEGHTDAQQEAVAVEAQPVQPSATDIDHPTTTAVLPERQEFTTENFKVEIKNLPKYYGYTELKKLLNSRLNLNARKIKIMSKGCDFTFVNFDSDEERNRALQALNGYQWKGRTLEAVLAKPSQDPFLRKRKAEDDSTENEGQGRSKGSKLYNSEQAKQNEGAVVQHVGKAVKDVVLPWWDVIYQEQIERKQNGINQFVKELTKQLCKLNSDFARLRHPETHLICPVEQILCSPQAVEYRNKCEFTVGYNPETKQATVGFRLASYRHGSVSVGPIDHSLYHLPKRMVEAALAFQEYIRQSTYKPFDHVSKEGTWKQLTVRTTQDGQLMMIILVNCNTAEDELKLIQTQLMDHFQALPELGITSFYFKEQEKSGSKIKNPSILLFGQGHITETLLGLQFRISPDAFFQINPQATEVMYSTIQALAETDEDTTLLDVCCGTGSIGICLARSCGQVLGVEITPDAITDAKHNANTNSLAEKCDFFAGKAEDVVDALIPKAKCSKIVAVVDPPRPGVNLKVIQSLRRCEQIKTIVFAFCDANAAIKNFLDLGRPTSKAYRGTPFTLTKLIPIDLFPGTPHYELVALFKR